MQQCLLPDDWILEVLFLCIPCAMDGFVLNTTRKSAGFSWNKIEMAIDQLRCGKNKYYSNPLKKQKQQHTPMSILKMTVVIFKLTSLSLFLASLMSGCDLFLNSHSNSPYIPLYPGITHTILRLCFHLDFYKHIWTPASCIVKDTCAFHKVCSIYYPFVFGGTFWKKGKDWDLLD